MGNSLVYTKQKGVDPTEVVAMVRIHLSNGWDSFLEHITQVPPYSYKPGDPASQNTIMKANFKPISN